MKEGQIKDITITVIPIVIGDGIPLFGQIEENIKLKHLETKTYEFGFVQYMYEIENKA